MSSAQSIMQNQKKLKEIFQSKIVKQAAQTAFYIPNSNEFLLEYTPKEQSMRYHLTGFTGSTGESVMLHDGPLALVVDGRYQVQADREAAPHKVEVVKAPTQNDLISVLVDYLKQKNITDLIVAAEFISHGHYQQLKALGLQVVIIELAELGKYFDFSVIPMDESAIVVPIEANLLQENYQSRSKRVKRNKQQGIVLGAGDDISWLANVMAEYKDGTRKPINAKALWVADQLHVILPNYYKLSPALSNKDHATFYILDVKDWAAKWQQLYQENNSSITSISIDSLSASLSDVVFWKKSVGESEGKVLTEISPVAKAKRLKSEAERKHIEDINLRASYAFSETLRWVLDQAKRKNEVFESDVKRVIEENFKKHGAVGQSFNTISAFGANSSLSHYGLSGRGARLNVESGDVALLDAGGQFKAGFVTDLTRTLMINSELMDSEKRRAIKQAFTLVLKAQINGEMSIFPEGTAGSAIDFKVRSAMFTKGMNFKHGTGHGVGFHVHEWGGRISVWSQDQLAIGQVSSIEPGYYLDEQWGIRHENLAIVEKHPQFTELCRFYPLVYIGWQESALDWDLFSKEESDYLREYQKKCASLGTMVE
jgi:Xaa-Pro aminopeptidase